MWTVTFKECHMYLEHACLKRKLNPTLTAQYM